MISQDLRNLAVGLVAGGGLAFGMADSQEREYRAVNLLLFGVMIWFLVILLSKGN